MNHGGNRKKNNYIKMQLILEIKILKELNLMIKKLKIQKNLKN